MKREFKIVHSTLSQNGGNGCAGGTCPTIYETQDGTYIVQGKKLSEIEKTELNLPIDEDLVEIPKDFLESYLRK